MDNILNKYSLLQKLNVSRETCLDLERYISLICDKNKDINIISRKLFDNSTIRDRHIIDSAQAIDFVDLNSNTTSDLGSGGGLPGIVMAIMLKNKKKPMKFNLYEKSYNKSLFLKDVSRKFHLDTEIIQKNIFETTDLRSGTIIARAFKPLPIVLDLVYKNFSSYKNLVIFMGKNGKKALNNSLKEWNFDYNEKKSITNANSFLLNIKNIEKKTLN